MQIPAMIFFFVGVLANPVIKTASAADEAYRRAGNALTDALTKGNKTVASLLDENSQWIEWNGKVHSKPPILEDYTTLKEPIRHCRNDFADTGFEHDVTDENVKEKRIEMIRENFLILAYTGNVPEPGA